MDDKAPIDLLTVADRICQAAVYLQSKGVSLSKFSDITGLHKNSVMRAKDLRIGFLTKKPRGSASGKRRWAWEEADREGPGTIIGWLWNPQIDTFDSLAHLVEVAEQKHGFVYRPSAEQRRLYERLLEQLRQAREARGKQRLPAARKRATRPARKAA